MILAHISNWKMYWLMSTMNSKLFWKITRPSWIPQVLIWLLKRIKLIKYDFGNSDLLCSKIILIINIYLLY